ncbi:MAG: hypothetical protein FWF22_09270 [Treponema sp.]|nr:hypothetical protein [Treponema sp.]
MKYLAILVFGFVAGFIVAANNVNEKTQYVTRVEYQPKIEYVKDPDSVPKSKMDQEIARTKEESYKAGYAEGRKIGLEYGYQSGYIQGTEYGQSLILDQIDLRIQEAEKTDKNIPLFRIRRD